MLKPTFFLLVILLVASCSTPLRAPKRQAKSFKIAWSKDFSPYYISGNFPYNRKTANLDDQRVFVGEAIDQFSVFESKTGKKLWSIKEVAPIVSTPLITPTMVIYGLDNADLVARDIKNYREVYRVKLSSSVNSAPLFWDNQIFLPLEDNEIVSLNAQTGELIWTYQRPVSETTTLQKGAQPIIYRNHLILGFKDGYYASLAMKNGNVNWYKRVEKKGKFVDLDLKALYAHRKLYVGGGESGIFLMDPESGLIGKRIDTMISASPLEHPKGIILGREDGFVELMSPEGAFIKRVKLGQSGIASLNHWGDNELLVITYGGDLYTLNAETFEPSGHFALGHEDSTVLNGIAVNDSLAAVYTSRYHLYILKR